jgi:hypothetical protein
MIVVALLMILQTLVVLWVTLLTPLGYCSLLGWRCCGGDAAHVLGVGDAAHDCGDAAHVCGDTADLNDAAHNCGDTAHYRVELW